MRACPRSSRSCVIGDATRWRTRSHPIAVVSFAGALAIATAACATDDGYFPAARPDAPQARTEGAGRGRDAGASGIDGLRDTVLPADGSSDAPDAANTNSKRACRFSELHRGGYCYFVPGFRYMTFAEGRRLCRIRGGEAATIESAVDNKLIYGLLPRLSSGAWIGLRRTTSGATFGWIDKSGSGFRNWARGEPNNEKGVERCAMIWGPAITKPALRGAWNDTNCETPGRDSIVCRRRAKP